MRSVRAIFIWSLILLSSCSLPKSPFGTESNIPTTNTPIQTESGGVIPFIETQSKDDKISEAKRRLNMRSMIRKGDYYSIKNDKEAALRYYHTAYSKTGEKDHVIERRLADTYFDLKNWKEAYSFYRKLPFKELDAIGKERLFGSFMYNETMTDRQKELDAMPEDPAIKEYYSIIGTCTTGIHNCVVRIQEYTGSNPQVLELKKTIDGATELSQDYQYRNSLLAGTLYKQKQYFASAKISEEIIKKRPDYRVVLKIAGLSRFELGTYEKANELFKAYYTLEPKDTEISYALGIVNYYLGDYSTSNLYFNTAVINGYRPKTELERRLVYNYYLLGDKKGTFKIFRYLLDEADVTEEDYEIAVFTAIEEREYGKASLWADAGIKKWPDSDRIIAMRGWIERIRQGSDLGKAQLELALQKNPRNAIALLQLGLLYSDKNDYTTAKRYLESAIESDNGGTFGEDATKALETIRQQELLNASGSGNTMSASGSQESSGSETPAVIQ